MTPQPPFSIGRTTVKPGQRITLDLPVARLYTHAEMAIPVHVIHGRRPGPRLFLSAAIHGDEINGVEIIRRILKLRRLSALRGTLLAVPVVNVYGFTNNYRYLPDRRDLNRFFPGSRQGSLTSRVADIFMQEIVRKCSHGIDIHTATSHRINLPQMRANLEDRQTLQLAMEFGAPVVLDADLREGSLREAAVALGMPMLLYEAGEAHRFDEVSIRAGVRGIQSVMEAIGMLSRRKRTGRRIEPVVARSSSWTRAPASGIFRSSTPLGTRVRKGDILGHIADPFGMTEEKIVTQASGIIIGRLNLPLVHEGDALFHVARFEDTPAAESAVEAFVQEFEPPATPPGEDTNRKAEPGKRGPGEVKATSRRSD